MKTVLFLCSGNYYRSRFAEILFNHLAHKDNLPWRADSRGLAISPANIGPISQHAVFALERLGIPLPGEPRMPLAVTEADLQSAQYVIAAKRTEHFPLVENLFPAWIERIEFWEIHDLDVAQPQEALPELERHVLRFVSRLRVL
jgi:protein-tyrosine phosphatase